MSFLNSGQQTLERKVKLLEQQIELFKEDLKNTPCPKLRSQIYDIIRTYNREYFSLTGRNYIKRNI
jgi:hypothetical protein